MMCDPNRPATVVPGRGNHRRWELMLLPGENDAEMMQPEKVAELLKPWLQNVPHNIVRAATYRFHGLVAEQWRLGNVFLAGDAAHQTPPFFGQGMCHGFRDAANLSWKLDLVLSGQSDDSLLDTYQAERDPHVRAVISAAVNAGRYICMLDPQQAAERDVTIREKVRRNELPTTAADLIPPVGTGIIAADTPKAGARFIQPWVQKGAERVLLDEITQGQWQLLVSGSSLSTNESSLLAAIQEQADIQATFLDDIDSPELDSWLKEANASAVLLRPDHYVYGTASAASLSDLLRSLAVQLLSSTTTFHFQERTQ